MNAYMKWKKSVIQERRDNKLFDALEENDNEKIENELQRGASPNARNSFNSTPLHIVASNGNFIIVELLLELGAEPNVFNAFGETPIDRAIAKNQVSCACILRIYEKDNKSFDN